MPRLDNWGMVNMNTDPYKPPEDGVYIIKGNVTGSPKFTDGACIGTSTIIKLDIKKGEAITKNSVYELGVPNPEWIKWLKDNYLTKDLIDLNNLAERKAL